MDEWTSEVASLKLVDVAKMLSMTPAHVRQLVVSGALRGVNTAREVGPGKRARWRVSPAAVAAFQQARSNQPADIASPDPAVGNPAAVKPKGGEEFV